MNVDSDEVVVSVARIVDESDEEGLEEIHSSGEIEDIDDESVETEEPQSSDEEVDSDVPSE
jgi:hypothetical protein